MNDQEGLIGWIIGVGGVIVSTLAGAVAMFYRKQVADYDSRISALEKQHEANEKELEACRNDRTELKVRVATLEVKLGIAQD